MSQCLHIIQVGVHFGLTQNLLDDPTVAKATVTNGRPRQPRDVDESVILHPPLEHEL